MGEVETRPGDAGHRRGLRGDEHHDQEGDRRGHQPATAHHPPAAHRGSDPVTHRLLPREV